jgi:2-phospho-L-lactate guanylyltransferase
LLKQTLALAKLVASPERIFLITADMEAMAQASAHGVSVIADHANDLNGALSEGRERALLQSALTNNEGLLILPIDLPLATKASLMKAAGYCDVTLACDSRRSGTNLLALRGEAVRDFPFTFGNNSFIRHRDIAQRAGYSLSIVDDPVLAFDLDTAEDYLRVSRRNPFKAIQMAS